MICKSINLGNGVIGIACGPRRKRQPPPCKCGARSTRLCDFVIGRTHAMGNQTCDKPLCDACSVRGAANTDHCPDHPKPTGAQLAMEGL